MKEYNKLASEYFKINNTIIFFDNYAIQYDADYKIRNKIIKKCIEEKREITLFEASLEIENLYY